MSWSAERSEVFRQLYASGMKFSDMATHLNTSVKAIRSKWCFEVASGRTQGLTDQRYRMQQAGVPEVYIGTYKEKGKTIKLYAPRFAAGFPPKVSAAIRGAL